MFTRVAVSCYVCASLSKAGLSTDAGSGVESSEEEVQK